jgi:hypothetical protein
MKGVVILLLEKKGKLEILKKVSSRDVVSKRFEISMKKNLSKAF